MPLLGPGGPPGPGRVCPAARLGASPRAPQPLPVAPPHPHCPSAQDIAALASRIKANESASDALRDHVIHLLRSTESTLHAFQRSHAWREAAKVRAGAGVSAWSDGTGVQGKTCGAGPRLAPPCSL